MNNNWIVGLILAILLASIAVIFALQNSEHTAISFLMWDLELPLALTILSSFIIGALTALFLTIPGNLKKRKRISTLKKENQRLDEQLQKMKQANKVNINLNEGEGSDPSTHKLTE